MSKINDKLVNIFKSVYSMHHLDAKLKPKVVFIKLYLNDRHALREINLK